VLVPLEGCAAFDVIEKWPLIQAYALEGAGGGGFFTLVHETADASPMLAELYCSIDYLGLEQVLRQSLAPLHRHWAAVAENVTKLVHRGGAAAGFDVQTATEPLRSFYTHGVRGKEVVAGSWTIPSFTVCNSDPALNDDGTDGGGGGGGGGVTHVCCEAGDATGPLWCARTLFLVRCLVWNASAPWILPPTIDSAMLW
jgi:hypothetical protein